MVKLKQFKNLIKCHFSYAFNKTIILMLFVIIIINIFYNYSLIKSLSKSLDVYSLYKYYFESSFSLIYFIDNIFIMSIFSFSFLKKQDQYCVILITSKISKNKVFISKYITILFIIVCFCFFQMISFYIPPLFFKKIKFIDDSVINSFIDLIFVLIFYGNLALLIILKTDNFYFVFIPIAIFIFSYNYILSQEKITGILKYIICLFSDTWRLYQRYGFVILTNIIIFIIIYKIYLKNEY